LFYRFGLSKKAENLILRVCYFPGSKVWLETIYRLIADEDTGEPEIVTVTRVITKKGFGNLKFFLSIRYYQGSKLWTLSIQP
jgi:hypothetical protein